jgi:DNA repair protein RadC
MAQTAVPLTLSPPPTSSPRPRRSAHRTTSFSSRVATVRVALVRETPPLDPEPIRGAADVFRIIGPVAQTWDREHFVSVLLDGKGRVIDIDEISVGSLTASIVHPRELFKSAILASAAAVTLVHNHPSGDPTPSDEDRALTARLRAAGDLLGIRVLDHVVIGRDSYYSMVDCGGF